MRLSEPDVPAETCVVTNRVFLLGLDELYRSAMKGHERGELLQCAEATAAALEVKPEDVPVEGYYAEDPTLTRYFVLMRSLQKIRDHRVSDVADTPEFQRIIEVTSSPIYGTPVYNGMLLPAGRDPLSQALNDTRPNWALAELVEVANRVARTTDDISLVGLAALSEDAVVLTALRESVVLYAEIVYASAMPVRQKVYVWEVDSELAKRAGRFVKTFNALFDEHLPAPISKNADQYWLAHDEGSTLGRCVRIGYDDRKTPDEHYHWAVCRGEDGQLTAQEFWDSEVWATERYREELVWSAGRCLDRGE